MLISFSPVRSNESAIYTFSGETIVVARGGVTEVYDFVDLPDGEAAEIGQGGLPTPMVLAASRNDGVLAVALLLPHGKDAPEAVRFPDNPMTVEQAEALLAQAYGGA